MDTLKIQFNKYSLAIRPAALLLFVFFLIVASYANSLYSPFVLDDFHSFISSKNIYLEDLSLTELRKITNSEFGIRRAIPIATFAADHFIGKGRTITIYHITNICIHLANALMVILLTAALLKTKYGQRAFSTLDPRYVPFLVVTLWALNPVQTNAVTYIVQRMASIVAFFYLGAMTAYIHGRLATTGGQKFLYYSLCLAATICAFLSKENSATIPLALLLVELLLINPDCLTPYVGKLKIRHWLLITLAVLLLLPLLQTPFAHLMTGYDHRHFTPTERLLTETRVIIFYISLLLAPLPQRLCLDHDMALSTSLLTPPTTLLALVTIMALLFLAVILRKKNPLCAFGILFFFLTLAIESTIIPLELIFEHRLYLPSVGFFISLVVAIDSLASRFRKQDKETIQQVILIFFVIIACALALLTSVRNYAWRDNLSLYGDSYAKSPNKPRVLAEYATALMWAGRYNASITINGKAIAKGRKFYEVEILSINNILGALQLQGKHREGIDTTNELLSKVDINIANGRYYTKLMRNLAASYVLTHDYGSAIQCYINAIQMAPADDSLYEGIARVFGVIKGAQDGKASQWDSTEDAVYMLLEKLAFAGRQYDKAERFTEQALQVNPQNPAAQEAKNRLAEVGKKNAANKRLADIHNDTLYRKNAAFRAYLNTSHFIFDHYPPLTGTPLRFLIDQALQIGPKNNFAILNLGKWLILHGRINDAIPLLEKTAKRDGAFFPFLDELYRCYQQTGNKEKMAATAEKILSIYPGHPNWRVYTNTLINSAAAEKHSHQHQKGQQTVKTEPEK